MAIYDITDQQYRSMDALSQSMAKRLLKSGKHYMMDPPERSQAFVVGSLIDCMVLTPDLVDTCFIKTPDWSNHPDNQTGDGKRSTSNRTGWVKERMSEFGKEHSTKTFVSREEWALSKQIASNIRQKPLVRQWLRDGKCQVALTGEIFDVECKGLLDLVTPSALVDLKTTRETTKEGFRRSFFSFGYDFQMAWYRELCVQNGIEIPMDQTYIIMASKEPPHDVCVFQIPEGWLYGAMEKISVALERFQEYSSGNTWPGIDGGADFVSLADESRKPTEVVYD